MAVGLYATGEDYGLPEDWKAVEPSMLELALGQAERALAEPSVIERLRRYYDFDGNFAGVLFSLVEGHEANAVTASDLFAVSTLSIKVPARVARELLWPTETSKSVGEHLTALEPGCTIRDLGPERLKTMSSLQGSLRSVLGGSSNRWVFAAKLCARKRPQLFPVRDSLVCSYLSGGRPLGKGEGQLGWFSRDVQVFAYLMTHPRITERLDAIYRELREGHALQVDESRLKLLDAALWMTAKYDG